MHDRFNHSEMYFLYNVYKMSNRFAALRLAYADARWVLVETSGVGAPFAINSGEQRLMDALANS